MKQEDYFKCDGTCDDDLLICDYSIDIVDVDKKTQTTTIAHTSGKLPININGWKLKWENKSITLKGRLNASDKMEITTPFDERTDLRSMKLTSPLIEDMVMYH
jgi:hypothetical protein